MKLISRIITLLRRLFGHSPGPTVATAAPLPGLPTGHRLVTGPPASGKSSLMEADARAAMEVKGLRLIVITATERMAARLTALPSFDPARHFIGSPRALCCRLIPPGRLSTDEELTAPALEALSEGATRMTPAAMVLIDDAHNLSPTFIRLVDRLTDPLTHSTTYFTDPSQAIFGFAGAGAETLRLLRNRAGSRVITLRHPRREVAPGAARVAARDADEAIARAAEIAASLIAPEATVALLTRTNAEARSAALLLAMRGTPHLLLTARLVAADSPLPPGERQPWRHYALRHSDLHELLPGGVTIATVHTARDRVASHVIVLDTPPPVDSRRADDSRRIATAIARATRSATIVSIGNAGVIHDGNRLPIAP